MRAFAAVLAAAALSAAAAGGATSGRIATVAGSHNAGWGGGAFYGDGGPATSAQLDSPYSVAALPDGGFLIGDGGNTRVRRVSPQGVITTVAGGDDQPFGAASDLEPLANGSYIAATANNLWHVTPNGVYTRMAPENFTHIEHVAITRSGSVLVDGGFYRVYSVSPKGRVSIVAGNGGHGYFHDGARATKTNIAAGGDIAALRDGSFLVAGGVNDNRIYRVSRKGIIHSVAGRPLRCGFGGDGGPATRARLCSPTGIAATAGGGFVFADQGNGRIRYVAPNGRISTIAGTGAVGFGGDGGPATAATFDALNALSLIPGGGILVADTLNHRIRRIESSLRPLSLR